MKASIYKLIDDIVGGYVPSVEEIARILASNEGESKYLFQAADKVRESYCQNKIHLRGIIEFSNHCRCKCRYCGINTENKEAKRYRMGLDEIIEYAKAAYEAGYKTIVLQSGEDLWYTKEKISYIIKGIKQIGDIAITLSIGEREYDEYKQWKEDGADRFLIKQETADEELYNRLHPHSNFSNRLKCLKWLKELGYQVGSGFMIGLPGQTYEVIAKDVLLLKELDVEMAGIGPFIPHPLTELKDQPVGNTYLTLKAVALARIIIKTVHLPATTALGVVNTKDKETAFDCGANVVMPKIQPYKYRYLYEIYPKGVVGEKSILEERMELERFFASIGKEVALDKGDSLKWGEAK